MCVYYIFHFLVPERKQWTIIFSSFFFSEMDIVVDIYHCPVMSHMTVNSSFFFCFVFCFCYAVNALWYPNFLFNIPIHTCVFRFRQFPIYNQWIFCHSIGTSFLVCWLWMNKGSSCQHVVRWGWRKFLQSFSCITSHGKLNNIISYDIWIWWTMTIEYVLLQVP
jgi:hypothetical protein